MVVLILYTVGIKKDCKKSVSDCNTEDARMIKPICNIIIYRTTTRVYSNTTLCKVILFLETLR